MEDEVIIAPGFRFYPTEEELIGFYLREKLQGRRETQLQHIIPVVDIYQYNPWDLPQLSGAQCRQDPQLEEWFFFIQRQDKEAKGGRPNRLTSIGYWKATGSPGYVYSSDSGRIIGEKRTMVFYKGRAPGSKTSWKMNEYRAINQGHGDSAHLLLSLEFSLCRVYIRSKCIRSFDRRPSPSRHGAIRQVDHHNAHQQPPSSQLVMMMDQDDRNCSSRENSSSSDDHQNASNHTSDQVAPHDGSNVGILSMDDQPLWEWEQYLLK